MKKQWLWIGIVGVWAQIGVAFADCDSGSCTNVKLTQLYIDANNNAYITTSGNQNNLSCQQEGNLILVSPSASNFKALYATLLAAKLQDMSVGTIRMDPSATKCTVAYVILR